MQPLTGDDPAEIGGYRLQSRLGSGGMGRVYLAATPAGRLVALKVVRPELCDDQEFRARFRQEIQAAQRVQGLYTAELVDADPVAAQPWLVTAYVPGPSLEEAIDAHGPMPAGTVLRLIAGVAEALQAIHAANVVHRDLKPSNVLLAEDGPRVIDFGIARALEATSLTRTGMLMGSLEFLAPEQILGLPISPAIDVFALGSLAVYAAVGRPPFGQGHVTAVSHRVVHEPPDLDGCPAQLLTLIESCLEKQASARPAPGRIIEFCIARGHEMADSSQSWPGWSLRQDDPSANAGDATSTIGGSSGGNSGEEHASVRKTGKGPRLAARTAAALVAAALVAVLIASVATFAASGRTAARDVTATRAPVTPAGRDTVRSSSPAPRRALAPVRHLAATPPAQSPTPQSQSPTPPAQSPSAARAPLVLLSQGHSASASSLEGYPWAASNAIDGNLQTRWSSGWSDPQWLEVDLGATRAVRKIVLDWEHAYATAFQIQVSVNGTTWVDIYSTTTGAGGDQAIQVSGTGRYVRMYGTHRISSYGYSLWEFQVFGH